MSEHGRGVNESNSTIEHEDESFYKPKRKACFLKCINCILQKNFSMEYFEFKQSYKRRTNVMSRRRISEFGERFKIDIGVFDLKSKNLLPMSV